MKNFTIIDTINLIITLAIFAIVGIIATATSVAYYNFLYKRKL